jgi:SAM-dependent methyltransferase
MAEPVEHRSAQYYRKALPQNLWQGIYRGEQAKLYAHFSSFFSPQPEWRVLDLGVDGGDPDPGTHFFERNYPFPQKLTSAGLEEGAPFREANPEVSYVQLERKSKLPFKDQEFDLVFCNAVIEHVGTRAEQAAFLKEIFRVGKRAFVTTPNRWYPVEFHTLLPLVHWLPVSMHRRLLRRVGFDFFADEQNMNLLDRTEFLSLVEPQLRNRVKTGFHRFLGWTSNYFIVLQA